MTILDLDDRNYNGRNGHDWTSLKSWSQAIGFIGIPGSIAIYIGASEIPKITKQQDALLSEIKQNREQVSELIDQTDILIRIAQRSCSNSAKDDSARQRCFDR